MRPRCACGGQYLSEYELSEDGRYNDQVVKCMACGRPEPSTVEEPLPWQPGWSLARTLRKRHYE